MPNCKQLLVLLAPLLLAACALGPDYQRPHDLTPAGYRTADGLPVPATTTTLLADMPWWEVFRDPQLQRLIQTALAQNQDLLIATARVEEARAMLGIASADAYPQIGANGSATRTRTPDPLRSMVVPPSAANPEGVYAPARSNSYAAMLDLSYEVDLWGRVRRTKQAARAELLASAENRQLVISTLVTDVARAYFTLLELDRELVITSETLRSRQQTLALMELRREHGTASGLEVSRFRAEVSASRAALATLTKLVFQAENALSILLGQTPREVRRGLEMSSQPALPLVPIGLTADLLERRPDVKASEAELMAATARIGAAKAAFFPAIALTGQAGYQSLELNKLIEANSQGWMIAGNLTQPIFEGGRNWFNYRATKARREQALQNYRKVVLQALREVSDALNERQQSTEERSHRTGQVQALQDSVRLSNLSYRAGQSSYLELLDAERQLFATQIQLEQARLEETLAAVKLYKALGGGVEAALPKS
jgi:multidrug efflux system outer membrane protein